MDGKKGCTGPKTTHTKGVKGMGPGTSKPPGGNMKTGKKK